MKHLFSALIALMTILPAWAQQTWPDGSKIDKWFFEKPVKVKGQEAKRFLITDYGAVADSVNLQTEAIQKAIDAAAEKGGTVVVPEGTFLISNLFFKKGTHLHLEKGAVLKGSEHVADFDLVPVHIEGVIQPYIAALINAYNADGFSITGEGTIDGNGYNYWREFWKRREWNINCTNLESLRPRLLYVAHSNDILVEGVKLINSPYWNSHYYKCDNIKIKDITIFAPNEPVAAPSSDAIDLDACNNVYISGCSFSVNDDIICMKGGKGPWADTDPDNGPNSNILVENCYFGRGPAVLTFGSECVTTRNVILRNSEVHGATRLLQLKMRPDTPQNYEYILVENVTGESKYFFFCAPWTQFYDLKDRKDIPMSYGSHITMRNCTLTCEKEYMVVENPEQFKLSDIVFENNNITETAAEEAAKEAQTEDWKLPTGAPKH